jgi:predicted enzyme related to lactoylglutathione lyase
MLAIADFAVTVSNARNAAEWWQNKLGFGVHTVGAPGGHAVMIAPPGERFLIHLCEGFAPVEAGNTGIAFLSDDIQAQVRAMEREGVVFTEPLKVENWGGSAKFADPDGNVFWLLGVPTQFIRAETARRARAPPPARAPRTAARRRRRGLVGRSPRSRSRGR